MTNYIRRIANIAAILGCGIAAWTAMWLSVSGLY